MVSIGNDDGDEGWVSCKTYIGQYTLSPLTTSFWLQHQICDGWQESLKMLDTTLLKLNMCYKFIYLGTLFPILQKMCWNEINTKRILASVLSTHIDLKLISQRVDVHQIGLNNPFLGVWLCLAVIWLCKSPLPHFSLNWWNVVHWWYSVSCVSLIAQFISYVYGILKVLIKCFSFLFCIAFVVCIQCSL